MLTRWTPSRSLGPFSLWRDTVTPSFGSLFGGIDSWLGNLNRYSWVPSLDLYETGENVMVRLAVPGLDAEHLSVHLAGRMLHISGEIPMEEREGVSRENSHFRQIFSGKFERTVTLPCEVQQDKIQAVLENGILTLTLPKAEQYQARAIPVRVAQR